MSTSERAISANLEFLNGQRMHTKSWKVKDPFKVQERTVDFNITKYNVH